MREAWFYIQHFDIFGIYAVFGFQTQRLICYSPQV